MLVIFVSGCSLPRWPAAGTMTSPFGLRFAGWRPEIHHGVDLAMPSGTPVRAAKDGLVEFAGTQRGYGTLVILRHGDWQTLYAHLSVLKTARGQKVKAGDVIALSGASGDASGPHLHFEVWRHGRPQDPVLLLGGPPPAR